MIISVVNQKGGVAKTTTVINLAAGLVNEGYKTLVIDVDPQASTTSVLDSPRENIAIGSEMAIIAETLDEAFNLGLPKFASPSNKELSKFPEMDKSESMYSVLIDQKPLREIIRKTKTPNLYIAPSHIRLSSADLELANALDNRSERLARKINEVKREYDFIVIDNPPSLGLLTINALTASEWVFIPVAQGFFSLHGLSQLSETLAMVKQQLNPNLKFLGVLPTKTQRTRVSKGVVGYLEHYLSGWVLKSDIPMNVKVEEAHSCHTHVFEHAPNSKGAEAYRALVKEILERI